MVLLGLGGNLGDRRAHLRAALALLAPDAPTRAVSSLYETEPVGYQPQPDFLNAVARVETALSPWDLLERLMAIERRAGRERRFRDAPRPIDLDILFFDDLTMDEEGLVIPHPRLADRAFVLTPLAELAPDLWHPWLGRPIHELLAALPPAEAVRLVEGPDWAADLVMIRNT